MRCVSLLAWAIFCGAISAAPVPKEKTSSLEKLYGEPEDPAKMCEYRLDGRDLVVRVSDKLDASAAGFKNAPRTKLSVNGDFEAMVSVKYFSTVDPLGDKANGHIGGGIAVWESEEVFMLVNRHHWPSPGAKNGSNWSGGFDIHGVSGGTVTSHGATCEEVPPEKVTLIKLKRVKDTFITSESRDDGKTWKEMTRTEHGFKKELNLGLLVYNVSHQKCTVIFSNFEVKSPNSK